MDEVRNRVLQQRMLEAMKRIPPICLPWLLTLSLAGCVCSNRVIEEVASPDDKRKAVIFMRDCGATSGANTQVSILSNRFAMLVGGGNVFIADHNHGRASTGRYGGPAVSVSWIDNQHLEIRFDPRARVFLKETAMSKVSIRYAPLK
jgi:hypothetical protein